jgi:hypothetical protein
VPDHISDTYITIDPVTGAVTFDFAGHVHATGLDLDASSQGPQAVTAQSKIRWLEVGTGAERASIFQAAEAASQELWVTVEALQRLLLDNAGTSAYAQLAQPALRSLGFTKLHSTAAFTYTAPDLNRRVYTPARTVDFDTMAGAGATTFFTAPSDGSYLIGMIVDQITVAGTFACGHLLSDTTVLVNETASCGLGADADHKGGTSCWAMHTLTAGQTVKYIGFASGAGNAVLTIYAIRLPV